MSSRANPEVEYTLEYGDYLALRRFCGYSIATTVVLWIVWFGAAFPAGVLLAAGRPLPAAAYYLIPASGLLLLARGSWDYWLGRLVRKDLEKNLPTIPQRVALGPDGLHTSTPNQQSFIRWSGVVEVQDTPDHLFLFLGPENAIIIPRRAFPDVDAFDNFAELAISYHEGTTHEAATPSTGITAVPRHQITATTPVSHDLTDRRND